MPDRVSDAGRAHAIATPHAEASAAGDAIFRRGGTAFDAALAAAAALTVCYPHMCAVGGDIIALAATPDGIVRVVNGTGAAPAGVSPERLVAQFGGMPLRGAHSVTVPGAVAAWETLRDLGGTCRLADLLEPAAKMAEEGVAVAPSLAKSLGDEERRGALEEDDGMNEVFRPGGRALVAGDLLVQPALARTLRALQANGAAALYRGPVGAAIVARLNALGSPMTTDDLAAHATEVTEPLVGTFGDEEVLTAPPNSQGLLLLEILGAATWLGDVDLLGADADLLAELFRLTAIDRDRHLADPRFAEVPVAELLSDAHAARLAEAALTRRSAGHAAASLSPAPPKGTGDTVAIVAADAAGNAVVIIQSVFYDFGSGILDPTTGVILHNRGAYFSVDPASPNVIAGGKRPAHTLMPVLVRRDGRVVGVHGTMGGSAQAQIHAQLLLRTARGEAPADAVAAPRFAVGGLGVGGPAETVLAEARCGDPERAAWAGAGFEVQELAAFDEEAGHAQMIRIGAEGAFRVATDPRCDGSALAG
jgi:gamma-glutamyltranspeptidase/glutathione hydrolase